VSCKGNHREEAETVEAKRVQLSDLDVFKVVQALRYEAERFELNAEARAERGWTEAELMWRKSATELYATIVKLEECDRVELVTDRHSYNTCPECGTVHSGLLDCPNAPLHAR
jgi:hypothetical protein